MEKIRIFLISGKGGSGKNSTANIIKEYYENKNEKSVITAYSKYIKLYARELTNWNGSDKNKPRTLLQDIGSMARYDIHNELFFINRMIDDIKIYEKFVTNIIIADVRLPLEITKIKEIYSNVYSIKVTKKNINRVLSEEQKQHITETALDNYQGFDYIIENNQDQNNLIKQIKDILNNLN